MNLRGTLAGELRDAVARETRFMRQYIGQVVDTADPFFLGRVRVFVPDVGWTDGDSSTWASPEYAPGCTVPRVGEWVVVYFMSGDPSRATYRGRPGEVKDMKPGSYVGPGSVVLLDDGGVTVRYDRDAKVLSVDGASLISINGDGKPLVTHAELNAALQGLVSALNLHTHPTAASGPPSPPTAPMSLDISAAATTTIKTGG